MPKSSGTRKLRVAVAAFVACGLAFPFLAAPDETFLNESFRSLWSALSRYRTGDDGFLAFFEGTASSSRPEESKGGARAAAPGRSRNPLQAAWLLR